MDRRPFFAILVSAALFGVSPPLAKLLLRDTDPLVLAGLLYAGAGIGLTLYNQLRPRGSHAGSEPSPLNRKDAPWLAGAIVCGGIAAPILLLLGLSRLSGFSASLLLNLEGVATALLAVLLFGEPAGRRTWAALAAMTAAGFLMSWDVSAGRISALGVLLVLAAMAAWGADNNFTRMIADKNPVRIAQVKGLIAGAFSLGLAAWLGRPFPHWTYWLAGAALGAFSYGISLVLFIRALSGLGAFRTGAFFSLGPFVGAVLSLVLLREAPSWPLLPGVLLMLAGTALIVLERHGHAHHHDRLVHAHPHHHHDDHHNDHHSHHDPEPERLPGGRSSEEPSRGHVHEHSHEEREHSHAHWPDIHHRHGH
ncbi:MAG: DMT family transporter [Candidatus Aminicenantes bacterium]|nr:DMT family transporter [Candidatus Aminicenantes bacterium]